MKIRDYQKHAVDNIITFLHSDNNKAKIYLSVGLGKSDILAYASKKIIEENKSVAILFLTRRECEQLRNKLLLLLETENLCCCIDEFHQGKIHTFPWPEVTAEQKKLIETTAQGILDARTLYPDNSLADMYGENMYIF